jgi:TPR repeat protein
MRGTDKMSNNYGEQQYNEAWEWIMKRNYSKAEQCFQNAIKENYTSAYIDLANLYEEGCEIFPGKLSEAFNLYKECALKNPPSYLTMLRMGCMYCENKEKPPYNSDSRVPHDRPLGGQLINKALSGSMLSKIVFSADDYVRAGMIFWYGLTNDEGRQFFGEIWGTIKCLSIAISLWKKGHDDFRGDRVQMEQLLDTAWEQMDTMIGLFKTYVVGIPFVDGIQITVEFILQQNKEIESMINDVDALEKLGIPIGPCNPHEKAKECMLALEKLQASL